MNKLSNDNIVIIQTAIISLNKVNVVASVIIINL